MDSHRRHPERYMRKARVLARVAIVAALIGNILGPAAQREATAASTETIAQPTTQDCMVRNPLDQIAPTLEDFGRGGEAYIAQHSTGFRGSEGYRIFSFGFNRGDADAYTGHPYGGYLYGDVVALTDSAAASQEVKTSARAWTRNWDQKATNQINVTGVGDEIIMLTQLTSWEIEPQQPMSEVFVVFRRCNVVGHLGVVVMPTFKPADQALRYVRLMLDRMDVAPSSPVRPAATSSPSPISMTQGCTVKTGLESVAPSLRDFGPEGDAYVKEDDTGFRGSESYRTYNFSYARRQQEAITTPTGWHLYGDVVALADEASARPDVRGSIPGWTRDWDAPTMANVDAAGVWDDIVVLTHSTPWEARPGTPMTEVFVAVRRCNVVAHYVVAVMPDLEPVDQALRYARTMVERMEITGTSAR